MINPGASKAPENNGCSTKKKFMSKLFKADTQRIASWMFRVDKRYPFDLPHNDSEPSEKHPASVDSNAAEPELDAPDSEAMDEETYLAAIQAPGSS